ncbi:unnamed protein product [Brassicogethes aeneus]|uniref:DUF4806 domain-containing protein n=1 Tax=Brassicogethes aeneus TaxID=1431903 RepID=A0A9P0FAA6_BRAAE|nr:unnamed protein product [Brassicogethes aeneus]
MFDHLKTLGAGKLREFLGAALKEIMTDELVFSFTWKGNSNNLSFESTITANILYNIAVEVTSYPGPLTKEKFKTELLEVFRATKQRFKNSLNKNEINPKKRNRMKKTNSCSKLTSNKKKEHSTPLSKSDSAHSDSEAMSCDFDATSEYDDSESRSDRLEVSESEIEESNKKYKS